MPKLSEREVHQKCAEFREGIRNFRPSPMLEKAGAKLVQQAEDHRAEKHKDSVRDSQAVASDLAKYIIKAPVSSTRGVNYSGLQPGQFKKGSGGKYVWDSEKRKMIRVSKQFN